MYRIWKYSALNIPIQFLSSDSHIIHIIFDYQILQFENSN